MQEIYVHDIGEGYPLVLVHGYLGSSEMWKLQKDYLKNYFRVITPALPGFGESYDAKSLNTINAMASTVLECIKEKKIDKFNLLGHSMGGMIVQEITKIAGDKVNKLICFATGPIGNIPDRFESLDVSIKRLKEEGIKETAKRIPPKWFVNGNKAKNYYLCQNAVKKISEITAHNALNAMKNWNGLEKLKNIKNQTLIIWGDKDVSYNFKQVETLNKNIPNSRLEVFKDCCHNVHLEEPEKFNKTVKSFLE